MSFDAESRHVTPAHAPPGRRLYEREPLSHLGSRRRCRPRSFQTIGDEVSDYSIQIKIPGGFEYDEAEIALAKVLKGTARSPSTTRTATAHSRTSRATQATSNASQPRLTATAAGDRIRREGVVGRRQSTRSLVNSPMHSRGSCRAVC